MNNPIGEWGHPAITSFGLGNYSIRSERYRLIQYLDGSRELYDLQNDPHEWSNVAAEPLSQSIVEQHAKFIPAKQHPVLPREFDWASSIRRGKCEHGQIGEHHEVTFAGHYASLL